MRAIRPPGRGRGVLRSRTREFRDRRSLARVTDNRRVGGGESIVSR